MFVLHENIYLEPKIEVVTQIAAIVGTILGILCNK